MVRIDQYIDDIILINGIIFVKVNEMKKIEYIRKNIFVRGPPYTRKVNDILISSITNVNYNISESISDKIPKYVSEFNKLIKENNDSLRLYFKIVSRTIDNNILLTGIPELYFVISIMDALNVRYSINRVERANLRIIDVNTYSVKNNCELKFEPLREFMVSGNRLFSRNLYKVLPTFRRSISLKKIPYGDKIIIRKRQKPQQIFTIKKLFTNICR